MPLIKIIIRKTVHLVSQDVQKGNNLNNEKTDAIYNCLILKQTVADRSSLETENLIFVRGGIQTMEISNSPDLPN